MQTIRSSRSFIALLTVFVLTAHVATAQLPPGVAKGTSYDADVLLRGIFFGRGPVAESLPEIWQQQPEIARHAGKLRTAQSIAFQEKVLRRMHDEDAAGVPMLFKKGFIGTPTVERARAGSFKQRFAADVQGGDRVRVNNAMREAAIRLSHAALMEAGVDPMKFEAIPTAQSASTAGGKATRPRTEDGTMASLENDVPIDNDMVGLAIVVVAAVGLVVLLVVAAVAVDFWVYTGHLTDDDPGDTLRTEMMVETLAGRLAVR